MTKGPFKEPVYCMDCRFLHKEEALGKVGYTCVADDNKSFVPVSWFSPTKMQFVGYLYRPSEKNKFNSCNWFCENLKAQLSLFGGKK